jgi:uncharacterized protein (UPF0548 family)
MAEWRFGKGWNEHELERRFDALKGMGLNFPLVGPESQGGKNWRRYYSESIIGFEEPGAPLKDGAFAIAWKAITEYQFSDPNIVTGHFRPKDPLEGRNMLLELKVWGLHYLCGARVGRVRKVASANETQWGFRYDTLESHVEVGSEWFFLTKKHDTGEIWFRISASWRPGAFPNWWSRAGFELLGRHYQLKWHRLAYLRLRKIVGHEGRDLVAVPYGEKLVHTGPEIFNSDIWQLEKENEKWPQYEEDKSSLLPGPHQVSDEPLPTNSPRPGRA